MNYEFMKTRAILPLVLSMSIPSIISMLVNSLYNIVDSFFVAQISENAMTAISVVFPIQNLSLALAVGFGVGINALIAVSLGAGDHKRADQAASVGVVLCFVHGLIMMAACIWVLPWFLGLYTNDADVLAMGIQYGVIVMVFGVMHHVYIGTEKIYQAVGAMKTTMLVMMVGCVINVILDPFLIFGIGPFPEMGIAGAALATGIGQTIQLVVYVFLYVLKPIPLCIRPRNFHIDASLVSRMYGVGIPASLNMALPSVLISVLNAILASYGQLYVVVLGVYYKLQSFVYTPANGLLQGIRPLVGYNLGSGEYERVHKIYLTTLGIAVVMMLTGTAICWLIPEQLMGLFTTNEDTINEGIVALRVISAGFAASALSVTVCGTLEGLGMGKESFIVSVLRYGVVIVPIALGLSLAIGAQGVWHAFWITEVIVAIAAFFLYRSVERIACSH